MTRLLSLSLDGSKQDQAPIPAGYEDASMRFTGPATQADNLAGSACRRNWNGGLLNPLSLPDCHLDSPEICKGSRVGSRLRPHPIEDSLGRPSPVNTAVVWGSLREDSRFRLVLWDRRKCLVLYLVNCLPHDTRIYRRQFERETLSGIIERNRDRLLTQDSPRVHPLIDDMRRHTRFSLPVNNRPRVRGSSSISWKQRPMDVHGPELGRFIDIARKNISIIHTDN